ncbi:MAG: hypothetical protein ACJAYC_001608 [Halieaceae bacterium]|jgi:hypothetical protein
MGRHIEMSSTPGEVFESGLGYHPNEAALALRVAHYRKPLSARLLPAPGLVAGDTVSFDNPRLTDAMVRSIQSIEFGIVGYMSTHSKILLLLISPLLPAIGMAQVLAPRVYWPTPVGTQLATGGSSYVSGDATPDRSLPISGVDSSIDSMYLGYRYTLNLFWEPVLNWWHRQGDMNQTA